MRINIFLIGALLSVLFISGCATQKDMYHWGEYEQLVYDSYINPGSSDAQAQISKLNVDIQQSENQGKRVAPGIYAHLGFMYAIQGKESQSQAAFLEEKSLYPESKVFIEGMLDRASKNKKAL
ncbi:MAG: DUF4810 domain-containing protein [Colwellia sp.]|jgi:Uncharacterized protein conserved in bacteria